MRYLFLAAVVFLAACPSRAADTGARPYTEKTYFSVAFPPGWVKTDEGLGLSDEEKKVYGAEVQGPVSGGFAVRIAVHYYAPDNLLHKTYEKFIKLHSKSALGANLDGKIYGKVKAGKAGEHYAKVFERKVFEYFPKNSMNPAKIHIYESFAVVPVKRGFFVLRYYAPMDLAKANLKVYESVLASFKPLLR